MFKFEQHIETVGDGSRFEYRLTTNVRDRKGRAMGGFVWVEYDGGVWNCHASSQRDGKMFGAYTSPTHYATLVKARAEGYRKLAVMAARICRNAEKNNGVYATART